MATLDLSTSQRAFSMTDPDLVSFNRAYQVEPTSWLFNTPDLHAIRLTGNGLAYDAQGRATAGLVNSITIDLGNNNAGSPDVTITGISASAPRLDDGPAEFWHFLEGNDVIRGPLLSKGATGSNFTLVGDGVSARGGAHVGGSDIIDVGDGAVTAFGDVSGVGSAAVGAPTADYRGGHDQILGLATTLQQTLSGDAAFVSAGSRLTGGNDTILIQSSFGSTAVGDAFNASGGDVLTRVAGGNDHISAGTFFRGTLIGDVMGQGANSLVRGGRDTISGGDFGERISGDVNDMSGSAGTAADLVGGDDTINGNRGSDVIAGDLLLMRTPFGSVVGGDDTIDGGEGDDMISGDVWSAARGARVTDGDDVIRGGGGNDQIWGDSTDNNQNLINFGGGNDVIDGGAGRDTIRAGGGDDWVSGGTGDDWLDGDAGADQMDGGAGADRMGGGSGDDTYYVNDAGDRVWEDAGGGVDTVWSNLVVSILAENVEVLRFNGPGAFTGIGNALGNTIVGATGADRLEGLEGDDILIGGAGADVLVGGLGVDTASYATASRGVWAVLTGSPSAQGTDAAGDTYVGVENLAGSDFGDILQGDDQANTLSGGAGDDQLSGFGGADVLIGGDGGEYLLGGDGADVLRGGNGFDILYAGCDADVFDFDRAGESGPGAARDVIRSLNTTVRAFEGAGVAGGDVIDLSGIDANAGAGGNQAFVFGGVGRGRVSVVEAGGNSLVRANTDGDAAFEFELLIEDGGVLPSAYGAGDFIL